MFWKTCAFLFFAAAHVPLYGQQSEPDSATNLYEAIDNLKSNSRVKRREARNEIISHGIAGLAIIEAAVKSADDFEQQVILRESASHIRQYCVLRFPRKAFAFEGSASDILSALATEHQLRLPPVVAHDGRIHQVRTKAELPWQCLLSVLNQLQLEFLIDEKLGLILSNREYSPYAQKVSTAITGPYLGLLEGGTTGIEGDEVIYVTVLFPDIKPVPTLSTDCHVVARSDDGSLVKLQYGKLKGLTMGRLTQKTIHCAKEIPGVRVVIASDSPIPPFTELQILTSSDYFLGWQNHPSSGLYPGLHRETPRHFFFSFRKDSQSDIDASRIAEGRSP